MFLIEMSSFDPYEYTLVEKMKGVVGFSDIVGGGTVLLTIDGVTEVELDHTPHSKLFIKSNISREAIVSIRYFLHL